MLESVSALVNHWQISEYFYSMFLIFCRIGAIISLLPGFGEQFITMRIKLFIALLLAFTIHPVINTQSVSIMPEGALLYENIVTEIFKGIVVGVWIRTIFMGLTIAAGFFSQILGITNIFDASLEPGGAPALSGFFSFTTIALIMASGGHYLFIQSMIDSYQVMPFLSKLKLGVMTESVIDAGSTSLMLGLRIALPFLGIGFLVNMGLGFVNRAMPQIPVFFVGQPLMIAVGFFLLSILIPSIMFNWSETLRIFLAERL